VVKVTSRVPWDDDDDVGAVVERVVVPGAVV
jgi:hypothetical protein